LRALDLLSSYEFFYVLDIQGIERELFVTAGRLLRVMETAGFLHDLS
jgi:hypothetical protein